MICSHSFAIEIKKEGEQFHMISPNCSSVENDVKSLNDWNKRLGGKTTCLAEGIETEKGCFQDISNCLPQALKDRYVTAAAEKDSFLRVVPPFLGDIHPDGINFMNYPFCKTIDFDVDLMAGDIGVSQIEKNGQKIEFEPFVYLNAKIAYLRTGTSKYSIGYAQDILEVKRRGTVHDECMTVGDEESPCQTRLDYFRCDSIDTLLEHDPDLLSQLASEVIGLKQAHLCDDKFLQQSPLSCDLQIQLLSASEALATQLLGAKGQHHLASLQMQRRMLKGDQVPPNPILQEFAKRMLPEIPVPVHLAQQPTKKKVQPSRSPASEKVRKKKKVKRLRSA